MILTKQVKNIIDVEKHSKFSLEKTIDNLSKYEYPKEENLKFER